MKLVKGICCNYALALSRNVTPSHSRCSKCRDIRRRGLEAPTDYSVPGWAAVEHKEPSEETMSRNSSLVPDNVTPSYRWALDTQVSVNHSNRVVLMNPPFNFPFVKVVLICKMDCSEQSLNLNLSIRSSRREKPSTVGVKRSMQELPCLESLVMSWFLIAIRRPIVRPNTTG